MNLRSPAIVTIFVCLVAADIVPAAQSCRCLPKDSCWPKVKDWRNLQQNLARPLITAMDDLSACRRDSKSEQCRAELLRRKNPLRLSDDIRATQSTGWAGAWRAERSTYAVEALSTKDVVFAVKFAKQHNLRLVIKGTGHDYLGRSNAPDSLLVWTGRMRKVWMEEQFRPQGCRDKRSFHALSAAAGARWIDAYDLVTNKHRRYVQGGGCTSVGVAGGFLQGGGFGSLSKKYGMGAANLLEAEVVTANGEVVTANACQNQDLYWALKGGGGGTFGVVTRVTLRTYDLPKTFGVFVGKIKASNAKAFQKLLQHFFLFYGEKLDTPHWGEQVKVRGDHIMEIFLTFQGLTRDEVAKLWLPFKQWLKQQTTQYQSEFSTTMIPPHQVWNADYWQKHNPEFIVRDSRPGQPKGQFFWASNQGEASAYWYAYHSRWIPQKLFRPKGVKSLAKAVYRASRQHHVSFHFNKGQAGASQQATALGQTTAINPVVFQSSALVIVGAASQSIRVPGIKGLEPDYKLAAKIQQEVRQSMQPIRAITPDSGSYVNETDYFEANWQTSFWGKNYARLLRIKNKYDPDGLFYCHHCVGSEQWGAKGMCRVD